MILDTLLSVGAFGVKATIKTVEVVGPIAVKAGESAVVFSKKEWKKAEVEYAKQEVLVKKSYDSAANALSVSADDFMAAWDAEVKLAVAK